MKREKFLEIVRQYRDTAPLNEYAVIDELIEYVKDQEDCFERKPKNGAKHIAASVLLVTPDFNKALFLWHTKIKCWTQPGGHADGNSNIHVVALKELEEETGINGAKLASSIPLEIYKFDYAPATFGYRKSIYTLFFVAILPVGQRPKIMESDKCEAMRWATRSEALEMIKGVPHDGTERLIQKWKIFAENRNS